MTNTTTSTTSDWHKRLARARSRLLLDQPFFGCLALQLEVVEDGEPSNPTMSTDGEKLYVNPAFVAELSDADLEFILAHEVMHVGLEHNARCTSRDLSTWNEATDHVVNSELVASGFKAPKTALMNPAYRNLAAEEIYAKLMKQKQPPPGGSGNSGSDGNGPKQQQGQPQSGDGNGNGNDNSPPTPPSPDPGQCGGVRQPQGSSAEQSQKLAEQRVRTKQAAAIAKAQNAGKLPGSVARLLELATPEVDWKTLLRTYINDACSQDYSWSRPSRRSVGADADFYLPGTINDGISHLVVAIDTSGSIDPPTLSRFFSEVEAAAADATIAKITVIYADAKVQRVDEFELGDTIVPNPAGGGGTAFSDTFRHVRAHCADAPLVIYFTDLYVNDFGTEPSSASVLWAVTGTRDKFNNNSRKPPFGHAIHIS